MDKIKRAFSEDRMLIYAMLFFIAVFAFYINRDIEIKGLYMDDLYMWSCYGEQSFLEFVFPIGSSTRFRPVYWLFTYIQMAIIGTKVDRFVAFNIICNTFVTYELFYIIRKVAKGRFMAFFSALCYLASRFAYYQIGQALGLMETMAQAFALLILYLLYVYLNKKNDLTRSELISLGEARAKELAAWGILKGKTNDDSTEKEKTMGFDFSTLFDSEKLGADLNDKGKLKLRLTRSYDCCFFFALTAYVLLCFTHERYLALLPLFYLVLFIKLLRVEKEFKKAYIMENKAKWISPIVAFIVIMVIRLIATGALVPAGTGGTEVTDTFTISSMLGYIRDEICYIFGINAGEGYLSALSYSETPSRIQALIKIGILMIGIICVMYALVLFLESGERGRYRDVFTRHISNSLLFVFFIGLCIAASSVTIRVEMRWVYVSYSAALIFLCYMLGAIRDAYGKTFSEKLKGTEIPQDPLFPNDEAVSAVDLENSQENGAPEGSALATELQGNIFRRLSVNAVNQVAPKLFYGAVFLVFLVYCALSVYTNVFYRGYFGNIYFWKDQQRMNSLAEETVEKYGADYVLGKDVYIIGNTYGMSDFYAETFFKVYDEEKTGQGTRIYFISSPDVISETALSSGNILVLEEVPEENAYRDITDEVSSRS